MHSRRSCLSGCTRKRPTQARGEKRVEQLLRAAVCEFAAAGYDGATMSGIAGRAGCSIGSLYQFFPNKESVARAVRTRQIEDAEQLWRGLELTDLPAFVRDFVRVMVVFVEGHPAFLPLLDAPSSTQPIGPRHRLRLLMAEMLRALQPRLATEYSERLAELVLVINKAMMGAFARSDRELRPWLLSEYEALLLEMLTRQLSPRPVRSGRARRRVPSG